MTATHFQVSIAEREKENTFRPLQTAQRKSSFAEALNKITPFNRRRTTALLPASSSTTNIAQRSRLPTPSGLPRSTSFLSSLHTFACRSTDHNTKHEFCPQPGIPERRLGLALDREKARDFTPQNRELPYTPPPLTPKKRDSSVKIEQRGLMQPMPPPIPRSSTMKELASVHTSPGQRAVGVSLTRLNISEIKRIDVGQQRRNTCSPSPRIVKLHQDVPEGFPLRKDSLRPPPARATASMHDTSSEESAARSTRPNGGSHEEPTLIKTENETTGYSNEHINMIRKFGSNFSEDFSTDKPATLPATHLEEHKVSKPKDDIRNRSSEVQEQYSPALIHTKQAPEYWLGRYMAVSDRLRSAALPPSPSEVAPSNPSFAINPEARAASTQSFTSRHTGIVLSDHYHPMHDRKGRNSRVFAILRHLCTTEEAVESLAVFRGFKGEALQAKDADADSEISEKVTSSISGGVREKKGFFNGLVRRKTIGTEGGSEA